MDFVTKYGLLGLMTALPTTPSFIDYKAVYFPANHFLREEAMDNEPLVSLDSSRHGEAVPFGIPARFEMSTHKQESGFVDAHFKT